MEYLLLIETGTEVCSVAISNGEELLAIRESNIGRMHAQNVAVYVEELLTELNITCKNLVAVAISMGPGSYTGLRIGSSFAKGICYAEEIPLIGVSSLSALTEGVIRECSKESIKDVILAPMIDARRMEVYTQLFDANGETLSEIMAEIVDGNSFSKYKEHDFVIYGNGAEKCVDILNVKSVKYINIESSARNMVKLAYESYRNGEFKDIAYFEPHYLKDFVSTTKKRDLLKLKTN